mgnify:CR=1 FL=1
MKKLFPVLIFGVLLGFGFAKKKLTADSTASYIRYEMEHPLHDWDARSTASKCMIVYDEEASRIEAVAVSVPVKSFDSGNSNRDSHALEVLEALKYRNVTFTSTGISENAGQLSIQGNLTFHGVTHPIVIPAMKKTEGGQLKVEGRFEINMKDYEVSPPSLMGFRVKEKIRISFLMVFKLM